MNTKGVSSHPVLRYLYV